jgi:DNA-directed RNA polymerase specialized sigma24 family protein
MIDRDRVMLVSDAVQRLPPRQRTVVILYYGCGLSIGEIAR